MGRARPWLALASAFVAGVVVGRVGWRALPDPQREAFLASARKLADQAQARADARLRTRPLHTDDGPAHDSREGHDG